MPDPFSQSRGQVTYFDVGYILTCIMMICQAIVFLQIARENLIIFVEEHVNQKLSKNLDWKNRGMETKKNVRRGQDANQRFAEATQESSRDQQLIRQQSAEEGSRLGTERTVNNPNSSTDVKKPIPKLLVSCLLYLTVVCFALLNCSSNNILAHLWVVIASIVCPLLDMFIPGIFYFKVMKDEDEEDDEKNASCNKVKRCMAHFYTFLGAVFLPLLLTLSTKALFSTSKDDHPDHTPDM